MSQAQDIPHTDGAPPPPPQFLTHDGPPNPIVEGTKWMPSGPVGLSFLKSAMRITCAMGPLGCGKTTLGFVKGLLISMMVPPSPLDGVRYAKGVVVAPTYRELDQSTIETYLIHFPGELGTFKGGGGAPAEAVVDWQLDDGTVLHLEIVFAAVGDHNVKNFCDGFEATWAFLNKLDALPDDIIRYMWPRTGRWPPPKHRPPDWRKYVWLHRKLFGDMNAPDIDNWTYGDAQKEVKGFVECVPEGWKLFAYPSGLDPLAENVHNLPPDYYPELVADNEAWFVNRFVKNKFGYSREGKPVYANWDQARHYSHVPLKYDPQRKLLIGIDGGRTACAIIGQRTFDGAVRILKEFIPPVRMGGKQFGKALAFFLAENFPNAFTREGVGYECYADPATANPNEMDDEATWLELVAEHADLQIKPAPSNAWDPRFESVDALLREQIEGEERFQVSSECRVLVRGFNSGFRYGTTKTHGDEVGTDEPIKNMYSHPHDALQYLCLGSGDWEAMRNRDGKRRNTRVQSPDDYHPHSF